MQCAITLTDPTVAYANKDSRVTDSLAKISTNVQREHIIAVIMLCVTTPREDTIVPIVRKVLLGMEKTVQISTNVQREHIIAMIMPCVTTPREDTVVPARKVLLGMEKTAQISTNV